MSRIYKKILLVFFGIFLSLLFLEAGLRAFNIPYKYLSLYRYDPETGLRTLKENLQTKISGDCYDAQLRTNNTGFHDDEFLMPEDNKEFRIAVLGDSFVEAKRHSLPNTFHEILESKLNDYAGINERDFVVDAFGIGGVGTSYNLLYFEKYAKQYKPDLVINMFFDNNDLDDDWKFVENYGIPEGDIDEYIWGNVYNPSILGSAVNYLANRLVVVDVARRGFYTLRATFQLDKEGQTEPDKNPQDQTFSIKRNELVKNEEVWSREGRLMEILNQKSQTAGADLMVVSFSSEEYSVDQPSKFKDVNSYMNGILSDDIHYLPTESWMRTKSIETGKSPFFSCDSHWSSTGHKWIASAIYEYIINNVQDLGVTKS